MSDRYRSQSEVIGVVLLVGVVATLVLLVGGVVFSTFISDTDRPLVSIDAEATTQNITVSHTGGDTLDTETVDIILVGDVRERYQLSTFTQLRGSDNTRFERGDKWYRDHGINSDRMEVLVIHQPSNTILDRKTIDVVETLAVRFDTNVSNPTTLDTIEFDATASNDPDGEIANYEWDFGDGTTAEGEGEVIVTHSYDEANEYDISLTVTTVDGRNATLTRTVEVFYPTPSAEFGFEAQAGERTVEFDASGSEPGDPDGEIERYRWDFTGDGDVDDTTDDPTITHVYDSQDVYEVRLTVEDDNGETATTTRTVNVRPFFEVRNLQTPTEANQGEEITVSATVENIGTESGEQTIEYRFDGTVQATAEDVELGPDEQTTVEFDYTVPEDTEPDTYNHGIFTENDSMAAGITVSPVAGEVDVQDEIQQSDDSFEVTTKNFENLDADDGGFLVVENNDTGDRDTFDEVGETTVTVDGFELNGGDEITATLYADDTEEHELDTDITVVDAAVLTVEEFTVEDRDDTEEFDITVEVTEEANTTTENLTVDLALEDSSEDVVINRTEDPAEIRNETIAVSFEEFGPLEAGEYTAVVTADADNAVSNTTTAEFEITSTDTELDEVEVTDVLPNADEQVQTFRFTLDSALPEDETVVISLDDAQSTGPLQVDYRDATEKQATGGDGTVSLDVADDSATLNFTANTEIAVDTEIEIRVRNINVSSLSDQNTPYTTWFNRTDQSEGFETAFDVSRDSGESALESVAATALWNTTSQEQNISFTPATDMDEGDVLSVDLTDAQRGEIAYDSASVSGDDATLVVDGTVAYLMYTAPAGGVDSGTAVTVSLDGVDASDGPEATYEVGFSRGNADTASAVFDLSTDGTSPVITPVQPEVNETVDDEGQIIEATIEDDESGVDEETIAVTVEDDGGPVFDDAGVEEDGIEFDGELLAIDITAIEETYESGDVDVTVEASDVVGNEATESWNFTVGDPPYFSVTIDEIDDEVTEGDEITVEYTVENTGDVSDVQDIIFEVNDTQEAVNESVELDASESISGTFTYETKEGDAPEVTVEVASENETASETVTVNEPAFFEVTAVDPQDPVEEGEELDVEITVENTGDVDAEKTVHLEVDADQDGTFTEEASQALTLSGGEEETTTLTYETEQGDNRLDGDAPEIDVRGSTEDDSRTVPARVVLPPGPVNFEAGDVGSDVESQEFRFQVDDIGGGDDQAVIDLTEPQSEGGIDYSGGDVEVIDGEDKTESVEYDEDSDQIIFTAQGNPTGEVTIEISGIDVVGSSSEFYLVEYSDDEENEDSDYFEIVGTTFNVEITDTNARLVEGETLEVETGVTNTGRGDGTQEIILDIDGDTKDSKSVTVDAGEMESVTLEWETDVGDVGEYTATVSSDDTTDSQDVTVEKIAQESLEFEINGQSGATTLEEGETVSYTATAIFNDGSEEDVSDEVSVSADPTGIVNIDEDVNEVTGDSGGETTVTATHDSDDGEFTDSVGVTVGEVQFIVDEFESPETAEQGEDISGDVSATIENEGTDQGTQTVELRLGADVEGDEGDDYEVIDSVGVTISASDGGEEVTFDDAQIPNDAASGEQEIAVFTENDNTTNDITIQEVVELELAANETDIFEGETVEFTVTDGDSNPIEDAEIEISNEAGNVEKTIETDEDGTATYSFDEEGKFDAVASKEDEADSVFEESDEVAITVTEPMANLVSGIDGTIERGNVGNDRELLFDLSVSEEVTLSGFEVETQNDAEGINFNNEGSTFGEDEPPTDLEEGEQTAVIRLFDGNFNPEDDFVAPDRPDADIVITLQFEDGSELALGVEV